MLSLRSFSFVAVAFSFGVVGLGARPAQAVICCSARPCQVDAPPHVCDFCNPNCAEEESAPTAEAGEIVYDEVESLCYVAGDLDPETSEDDESAGCE